MKKYKKVSPEAKAKHDLKRFIIQSFCPNPEWGKDMKIAGQLVNICNDKTVWEDIIANSRFEPTDSPLIYFLSSRGKAFLREKSLEIRPKTDYNLSQEKIGEDVEIVKKPQTLLEFLKN